MNAKYYSDFSDTAKWFLCHATHESIKSALDIDEKLTINVQMNGVETGIDFDSVMREVEAQIESMVEKRAKILLENECVDVIESLQDIKATIAERFPNVN